MEQKSSTSGNVSPDNNLPEKYPSTNSVVSTSFLVQLLKANETTPSLSSVETENTDVAEQSVSSSPKHSQAKKNWVLQKKEDETLPLKKSENAEPSSVLKNLHLDHQYISQLRRDIAPIIQEQKTELLVFPPKHTTKKVYTLKLVNPSSQHGESNVLAEGKKNLRMALTGEDEFVQQTVQRAMAMLGTPTNEKPEKSIDAEGVSCIPNAAAIQNNFQDVLNMTSFQPISDGSGKMRVLERNLSEVLENHNNPRSENCIVKPEKSCDTKIANSCNSEDTDKISENDSHAVENLYETELDYALKLMIQRWSEYLKFTEKEMYQFELENAKYFNLTTDVIEMLEDRGRYVWQLIEEM